MSEQPDTLKLRLLAHADAVLSRMNALREEQRFCDVTLLLRDPLGAPERPFCFQGHKVVLAAASGFLRDQFLLHEGQAELTVSPVTNVEVGKRLLLSCYTGLLEVPRCELVTYLTVASALQMNLVVEQCTKILSVYFNPSSKEEKTQQTKTSFNIEIQAETTFEQQVEIHTQQQIVGGRDSANAKCSLTMLECEADRDKTLDVGVKKIGLSNNVQNLKYEHNDVTNCTMSEDGKHPVEKGGQVEHSQKQDDGKVEVNNKTEKPVTEPEISIKVDMHKKQNVKSEDTVDGLTPQSNQLENCDHVFDNMDNYVEHIKDQQLYQCLVCEKSFSQKSGLSHHLRVHIPVKPYRCPLCHSTFPNKASLQYHINLHVGYNNNTPLKCNYCTAKNDFKQGLRLHLKDNRGINTLENVLEEADC